MIWSIEKSALCSLGEPCKSVNLGCRVISEGSWTEEKSWKQLGTTFIYLFPELNRAYPSTRLILFCVISSLFGGEDAPSRKLFHARAQGLDCSSGSQGLFTRRLLSRASTRLIVARNFGNAVAECAWDDERCCDSVGSLPRMRL